jgi:hypothetical protein
MSIYTRKILLAAVLSLSGMGLTYGWYRHDLAKSIRRDDSQKTLLAQLGTVKNEVQKKQKGRVIWKRVDEDEPLYSGEHVRTTSEAEAKIRFNSGVEVDLDPDSVVVIEEMGDKATLDFIQGNIYVKGGDQPGSLALKSGNASIDVSNADLAMGKQGSAVNVQVSRGTAQLTADGKQMTLDDSKMGSIGADGVNMAQQFFKIIKPSPNEKFYVRPANPQPVVFSWTPLPEDFDVRLEIGSKRELMKPASAIAAGVKGQLTTVLRPGTQFWRLVATNRKDPKQIQFSTPAKLVVVADIPPKLLFPKSDSVVTALPETRTLELRWANPSRLVKLELEVAKDPQFKQIHFSEPVDDTGVRSIEPPEDGEYYWRISGTQPNAAEKTVSNVQKFVYKSSFELVPPELKQPINEAFIPFERISSGGIFLVWNPVPGAARYAVKLESDQSKAPAVKPGETPAPYVFEKELTDTTAKVPADLKPGRYIWSVATLDNEEGKSKYSTPRPFSVEEVPRLLWSDGKSQENYFYVTPTPSFRLAWKPTGRIGSRFKISVRSDSASGETPINTTVTNQVIPVAADGLYHVTVEEFDGKGAVIAKTETRDVVVMAKPLLPAPQFAARTPATVQAFKNGSATLSWDPVSGARFYLIQVKDGGGKVAKQERFNSATGSVKNLLPGQYKVSLSSVDEHGRVGPTGEERILTVPEVSDLRAPQFKKFKIK